MTGNNLLIISSIKPEQESLFTDAGAAVFYPDQLGNQIQPGEINILYGWNDELGNQVLNAQNSQLKWVHAISAGVDYLPLQTFANRKIKLTNASGIHAEAISQSVISYVLYFTRSLDIATLNQRQKHWADHDENRPHTVSDFSYVIFGTGHIGQQIARLLKTLGAHTIGINTTGHQADYFDETLALSNLDNRVWQADVLINVMPLTDSTHHFFDQTFFDNISSLFLFINVGRGPVVDSNALIDAIKAQSVQHAALDVFEEEPLLSDSPFWTLPNTIITPHNTGVIRHFKQKQVELFIPNLNQFLNNGTFRYNQVNLSKGY